MILKVINQGHRNRRYSICLAVTTSIRLYFALHRFRYIYHILACSVGYVTACHFEKAVLRVEQLSWLVKLWLQPTIILNPPLIGLRRMLFNLFFWFSKMASAPIDGTLSKLRSHLATCIFAFAAVPSLIRSLHRQIARWLIDLLIDWLIDWLRFNVPSLDTEQFILKKFFPGNLLASIEKRSQGE